VRKIGEIFLKGLLRALGALPLGFHYAWSWLFAWLLKNVIHYRKEVVMTNIARSFPEMKYGELKELCRDAYLHFADIIAEALWFNGCRNPKRLHDKCLVETFNPEVLYDSYNGSRNGVMVMTSHSGNWELLGGFFEYDYKEGLDRPFDLSDTIVVYKPLKSKTWNELMRVNRCAPILRDNYKGYVSSTELLRHALSHRDEKKVYIVINDQYPYAMAKAKDPVTFMHQKTYSMEASAALARKLGMSVVYMNMAPDRRGHYLMKFTEICRDSSQMEAHEIDAEFYRLLENDLNETPWNYLWTHKRWK